MLEEENTDQRNDMREGMETVNMEGGGEVEKPGR